MLVGREDGNLELKEDKLGEVISEENSIFSDVEEEIVRLLVSSSSWLKISISVKEWWFGSIRYELERIWIWFFFGDKNYDIRNMWSCGIILLAWFIIFFLSKAR